MKHTKSEESPRQTGTIVFYSIYFVLLAAVLSAAAVGLGKLWEFLQRYEACQIYHLTDEIAEQLNSGKLDLLYGGVESGISPFETEEAMHRQLSERFTGVFSLKKNIKKSTKDVQVYTISCGEDAVAFAEMTQTGSDSVYGFEIYGLKRIYGIQLVQNEKVTLTMPTGCRALINGVALDETPGSWSSHTTDDIPEAEEFGEYLADAPKYESYTIEGLMYPPEVGFTDGGGKPLPSRRDDKGTYSCDLPVSDSQAADDAGKFALEFSEMYSRYIANDAYFSSISGYIPEDTKLYSDLRTYEGQFYTYHNGYDFTDEAIQRVTQYSDSCFAVRVSYTHNVYYGGETYAYPADNTIFAVNTGAGWRAVGLIMN